MTWATQTPAERTAAVRQLVEVDRLSFGAAAIALGATKNSIIGFAKRHGIAQIHHPEDNKVHHLGYFNTAEAASIAYESAASSLRKEFFRPATV